MAIKFLIELYTYKSNVILPTYTDTFADYLDPFLHENWGDVSDLMGFRSVLKLTPSHPRNPNYK